MRKSDAKIVKPALEQAQMMIMPDIEEPFVPIADGLFVDPLEARYGINSFTTSSLLTYM